MNYSIEGHRPYTEQKSILSGGDVSQAANLPSNARFYDVSTVFKPGTYFETYYKRYSFSAEEIARLNPNLPNKGVRADMRMAHTGYIIKCYSDLAENVLKQAIEAAGLTKG